MNHVRKFCIYALALGVLAIMGVSASAEAPDATDFGPYAVTSAEYKFPASVDPDVLALRATELWAVVFRPDPLDGGPFPVLILLHGNHSTCGYGQNPRIDDNAQYTFFGTCPNNYVVTPNHRGYDYLAERLASWGYIVVSINANRGINAAGGSSDDLGLNLARGKLLLKHMQRLSEWNRNGGTPAELGVELRGKLDFNHVGLFGHSRGGEGVRAAYNLYRDTGSPWPARIGPVKFEGVFEVGPVDGQTSRILNADGTAWNLLLGMCDGDVSNLQGIRVFDRMMLIRNEMPATQKSTFNVWGANHNYFNSEWQLSDSPGCVGHSPIYSVTDYGSENQRQTSLASAMAFFRGNVGTMANPMFTQIFNPLYGLPGVVTSVATVDRGYTDSPNSSVTTIFEDFDKPTGTNTFGFPNDASNIMIRHSQCSGILSNPCPNSITNHNTGDPYGRFGQQQTAAISWTAPGASTFFQTNWTASGTGMDISNFATVDFRFSRQCATPACDATNSLNPTASTNFSLRLSMADGTLSDPVSLNWYVDLNGPVGGLFSNGVANLHPLLVTGRVPLGDFSGADLTKVRGVRLTFDDTPTGAIFVSNIRLSRVGAAPESILGIAGQLDFVEGSRPAAISGVFTEGNSIAIRTVPFAAAAGGQAAAEIELTSAQPFPVRNELPILRIGQQTYALSRYPENGDTHTLIFTLTLDEFAAASSGDEVSVQYGIEGQGDRWIFGMLNKAALNQ